MNVISTLFGEEQLEHVKTCIKCGETKSIFEFPARIAAHRDMLGVERRNECKDCMKKVGRQRDALRKNFPKPDTLEVCPICGRHESKFKKRWCLDHDHITGEARGWICDDCNGGLGKFLDNPEACIRAADYLRNGGTVKDLYTTIEDGNTQTDSS